MTKFRLAPMDRTDLIRVDPSQQWVDAAQPMLRLDTRDGDLDICHRYNSDIAVPASVYYGFVRRWEIPATTDARRFSEAINVGELDTLFTRIVEGASSHWDGSNHVCRLTEDAEGAIREVERRLNDWADTLPDGSGLWSAGDWFVDGPTSIEGLTADTSDDELVALAASLEEKTLADCVVLAGVPEYLREAREKLRAGSE